MQIDSQAEVCDSQVFVSRVLVVVVIGDGQKRWIGFSFFRAGCILTLGDEYLPLIMAELYRRPCADVNNRDKRI